MRQAVDWCPPWPMQPTLTRLIADGHLDRHITRATRQYRTRRDEIVRRLGSLQVPVRPLSASAGLHVAVLIDGVDSVNDRALHDAAVAEDLMIGSLARCYRFSTAPGGLLLGFGAVRGSGVAEAIAALERVLVRVATPSPRVDAS